MTQKNTDVEYEYQVGGSLRIDAPSYIRRQADEDLFAAVRAGQFCYVLNCRQMGKSSLRVRSMVRLRQAGVYCISIDMTRISSEHLTPQQWYEQMISELWRSANLVHRVNLKDWLQAHRDRVLVQLLIAFIEEVLLVEIPTQPIAIFIDEIDSVLNLAFSINDFFALIRACYNQRVDNPEYARLTFCLLGVATPADLITDKTRTPFNLGRAIALHGFTVAEAQGLATGLAASVPDPIAALREILHWTNGQPFLTQKLCRLVVQAAQQSPPAPSIESIVRSQIIAQWESQDEPEHLRTIRDRLLRDEQRASRLLGLYAEVLAWGTMPADDRDGQMELRLSGLVVKQGDGLRLHNLIYAAVFDSAWIEATLDRLRPYQAAFQAWVASAQQDESRLLRGQALAEALEWSAGRSLSSLDALFLSQSQAIENRETKQANAILAQANRRAKRQLRLGSVLLGLAVVAAGAIGVWSFQAIDTARAVTRLERESRNALERFNSDQTYALLAAMRSVHELKDRFGNDPATYPTTSPMTALQTILHQTQARSLPVSVAFKSESGLGSSSATNFVQFTTQGDRVITAGVDAFPVIVTNLRGDRLATIEPNPDGSLNPSLMLT